MRGNYSHFNPPTVGSPEKAEEIRAKTEIQEGEHDSFSHDVNAKTLSRKRKRKKQKATSLFSNIIRYICACLEPPSSPNYISNTTILIVAFFITLFTFLLGFYYFVNVDTWWSISTSFFYTAQSLFGDMYNVPADQSSDGAVFTLTFYIFGECFFAVIIARFADQLVSSAPRIAADERKRVRLETAEDLDGDGVIGCGDSFQYHSHNLSVFLEESWDIHSNRYISAFALLVWIGVGILYGTSLEGWSVGTSVYFSIGLMSDAGVFSPVCEDGTSNPDCLIYEWQGIFAGIYIIIGVPIYTIFEMQLVSLLVERSVRDRERKILNRPLTKEEYQFAFEFLDETVEDSDADDLDETMSLDEFEDRHANNRSYQIQGNTASVRKTLASSPERIRTDKRTVDFEQIPQDALAVSLSPPASTTLSLFSSEGWVPHDAIDSTECLLLPAYKEGDYMDVPQTFSDEKVMSVTREDSVSDSSGSHSRANSRGSEGRKTVKPLRLAEYVVLELLRLQRVERDELEDLKRLFEELDMDNEGLIDLEQRRRERRQTIRFEDVEASASEVASDGLNSPISPPALQQSPSSLLFSIDSESFKVKEYYHSMDVISPVKKWFQSD